MESNTTKSVWIKPELETLSVEKTLGGPIELPAEGTFTDKATGEVTPGS